MNKILLFPTFIGHNVYAHADAFRDLIFDTIDDHKSPDGYSHELTGNLDLQKDVRYSEFFSFVTECAMEYVASLQVDPNQYDYNIVKSWFNITRSKNNPKHSHKDAHLSFAYYISTPQELKKMICFFSQDKTNELYAGMFNNVSVFNLENASSWSLDANQGEIYIFPAKLEHAVIATMNDITNSGVMNASGVEDAIDDITKFRVAIAGDIVLTHKEKALVSLGLQPVKNWKTFEVKIEQS
jgi:hypothetical protein